MGNPDQQESSPVQLPEAWDLVSDAYSSDIDFSAFAREALRVAKVGPGARIVDVATGPGTLAIAAAQLGVTVSAIDFSPGMIAQLEERLAQEELGASVSVQRGDGQNLPYDDEQFDAGFSMFGLFFFSDRERGFRELYRVLNPGGVAVVSSWVPFVRVPLLHACFTELVDLLPGPKPEERTFPLADADTFRDEMTSVGFSEVQVLEFSNAMPVGTIPEMIASFEKSSVPVALARDRLGDKWPAIAVELILRLEKQFGRGPHEIEMIANLGSGRKPA